MARQKTRAELVADVARLQPYVEATICLQKMMCAPQDDERYVLVSYGDLGSREYRSLRIVGLDRAAGGVVIAINGEPCGAEWLTDVVRRWSFESGGDPYSRECARLASKRQTEAIWARTDRSTVRSTPAARRIIE